MNKNRQAVLWTGDMLVSKNGEFCVKNEELRIENDEFCSIAAGLQTARSD